MPEVLRTRDATRSLRRPDRGLRQACMRGCPSMIQPVAFAVSSDTKVDPRDDTNIDPLG